MNKPRKPTENKIVYQDSYAIIVWNRSEEFGESYYVFGPNRFGTVNFSKLEDAISDVLFQTKEAGLAK